MSCSNLTLYLFDMLLRLKAILGVLLFSAIVVSLTGFFVSFLASQEDEKTAEKSFKFSLYIFLFFLATLVIIILLPSENFLEHMITNGC